MFLFCNVVPNNIYVPSYLMDQLAVINYDWELA